MRTLLVLLLAGLAPIGAQDIKFPESFDRLAARAKDSVSVSLDGPMLQLAGNFLSSRNAGEAAARKVAGEIKGIHVRTFEFAKEGEYTDADIAPFRAQLTAAAGWSNTVNISEPGERVEVYARKDGDRMVALAVMVSQRRELTVVYVNGPIDIGQLSGLVKRGVNIKVEPGKTGVK